MAKFKTYNKGYIGQKFANPNIIYADRGGVHSGVDSVLGWNKPVVSDNAGLVYKIITSELNNENWQGVYQIVPHGDHYVEVCQGHFNTILVRQGESIPEGAVVGLEGNKGFVFSNGKRITIEMQKAGSREGTHTHTSYRPVRLVEQIKSGEYYLEDQTGRPYYNKGFYQIIKKNNGTRGCVDPYIYLDNDDNTEKLNLLAKLLPWLKKRLFNN